MTKLALFATHTIVIQGIVMPPPSSPSSSSSPSKDEKGASKQRRRPVPKLLGILLLFVGLYLMFWMTTLYLHHSKNVGVGVGVENNKPSMKDFYNVISESKDYSRIIQQHQRLHPHGRKPRQSWSEPVIAIAGQQQQQQQQNSQQVPPTKT
jgi:hypothetical protein